MSRIGKKPVPVPSSVTATITGQTIKMKGPKGELAFTVPDALKVQRTDEGIDVSLLEDTKLARSKWGMSRTQIANLIKGVTDGYSQDLEIHGVGFKASMKGKDHSDALRRLQPRRRAEDPGGRRRQGRRREAGTGVRVTGIDKQAVGQVASVIRASRKPEPYQGKGVRYKGEYILRKEGKKK